MTISDPVVNNDNGEMNNGSGNTVENNNHEVSSNVSFRIEQWDYQKHGFYSDMIHSGLQYKQQQQKQQQENGNDTTTTDTEPLDTTTVDDYEDDDTTTENTPNVVMLYESPSCCANITTFHNANKYIFHDYPPADPIHKKFLVPCRYSMMNGSKYASYLSSDYRIPLTLVQHWQQSVPNFVRPKFVSTIKSNDIVYTYLPVESIASSNHINDPLIQYHLCGKDAIPLMTTKNNATPKILPNTKDIRPCICKTTHSMGGKGIFIINNDEDDDAFYKFLDTNLNPNYIVTEFITIQRNIACHFFIHPDNKTIIWLGSNENLPDHNNNGGWSKDSVIDLSQQTILQQIQEPFVYDIATYFHSLGYWGFCGIDILVNDNNIPYLVDVNPRLTGSLPAIMTLSLLNSSNSDDNEECYKIGMFRRSSRYAFNGTTEELFNAVNTYNEENIHTSRIIVAAYTDINGPKCTLVQYGIYSKIHSVTECEAILNQFTITTKLCLQQDPIMNNNNNNESIIIHTS